MCSSWYLKTVVLRARLFFMNNSVDGRQFFLNFSEFPFAEAGKFFNSVEGWKQNNLLIFIISRQEWNSQVSRIQLMVDSVNTIIVCFLGTFVPPINTLSLTGNRIVYTPSQGPKWEKYSNRLNFKMKMPTLVEKTPFRLFLPS